MAKLTHRQIQQIIKRTPAELKGKQIGDAIREELGTFQPADANWSYHAGWLSDGTLVVLRYGEVM